MTVDVLDELIRQYEIRRRELFVEGRNAEARRNFDHAAKCRGARILLELAMNDEIVNRKPVGLLSDAR